MAGTGCAAGRGVDHPKSWVAGGSTPSPENPVDQGNIQLSAEQAKSLGIAGDTPRDTVATLVR
jgi:hypothetical protein